MKWISDYIGEEYKEWKDGDKIFITSPTGSGKSRFILNILLPYFSYKKRKILYLVNRRILKEQIEMELSKLPYDQRSSIEVELYQSIENKFCAVKYQNYGNGFSGYMALGYIGTSYLERYDCVVCDECHYFLADANYNTNTAISFRIVNDYFKNKVRIFMSATIDEVKQYLLKHEEEKYKNYGKTNIYEMLIPALNIHSLQKEMRVLEYKTDIDYRYLDISVINNEKSDIIDLIKKSDRKNNWLIFVDNISFGMELKRELNRCFQDGLEGDEKQSKNVVMLSSDYREDEESINEVNHVINENIFKAKVIISTSVMDNGINIKDPKLRNMIVIADNKVEFIQMLGRKREDGQRLKLYIIRQSRDFFAKRQRQVQRRLEIAKGYRGWIENIMEPVIQKGYQDMNIKWINASERNFAWQYHIMLTQMIAKKKVRFEDVASLFCIFNGQFYLNLLSMENLDNLNQYYQKILERYDAEGKDAFVRQQLEWLGKTSEEIEEIIKGSCISTAKKYHADLKEKFEKIVEVEKTREQAIEFKKDISDKLRYLVELVDETIPEREKVLSAVKRNDRPLSKKDMEFLKEYCDLPFWLEVQEGNYTLHQDENKK